MTLEELKKEAAKLGYCLNPVQKRIRRLPCTCGRKVPRLVSGHSRSDEFYMYCPSCRKKGPVISQEGDEYGYLHKTLAMLENEAIEAWNRTIEG